jgi:uncharacterized phage protein (TIGR02218 family)
LSIEFQDHQFEAATGMDAQALQTTNGLAVNNSAAIGALSAVGLTEEDIAAGKYDGAEVFHWIVNWQDVTQSNLLFRGFLGEVKRSGAAFEVELRGLTERLNQPVGRNYARTCSHILGDARCGVDVSDPIFASSAVVSKVTSETQIEVSGIGSFEEGWFSSGVITWTSGDNAGEISVVNIDQENNGSNLMSIWEATNGAISVGDTFDIHAGCNRSGKACAAKFNNLINFGGFPYLPGEDWSVAYPVKTNNLDGQSLYNGLSNDG